MAQTCFSQNLVKIKMRLFRASKSSEQTKHNKTRFASVGLAGLQ